jgi:polyhydroxyalkanoate synthesis regulator phasin
MSIDNSNRMLALCIALIRQRLNDDLVIDTMLENGSMMIKAKSGGLLRRDHSKDFREDLRRRIREAQELLERAGFALSDEALVDALEQTNGHGSDAKALWAEIRLRGLAD